MCRRVVLYIATNVSGAPATSTF